jgi:hypothetical protein
LELYINCFQYCFIFAFNFNLRRYDTEEGAARACNIEAERVGRLDPNVIPPADDSDDDDDGALALLSLAAVAHAHAGAGSKGSKRAGAPTLPAPPRRKKPRLHTSAGATAGAAAGGLGLRASGGVSGSALEARIKLLIETAKAEVTNVKC